MARIRSLKPEFWADEDLATYTGRDTRLMYMGLWNLADEHARLRGDPRYIKGQLFAYDDDLTPAIIDGLLAELAVLGKLVRYRVNGSRYLFLPKLSAHQRLEPDKTPSRFPGPEDADPDPEPEPEPDPDPEPERHRSENRADVSEKIPEESAQKRTVDEHRSPDDADAHADLLEPEIPEKSAQTSEEPALVRARLFSKEHVAGGFSRGAGVAPAARTPSLALVPAIEDPLDGDLLPAGNPPPENAGHLTRAWIDFCRDNGVPIPPAHIKRYGSAIKKALDRNEPGDVIKRALAEMLQDRVVHRPNLLDNYILRTYQGPELPPRRATQGEAAVIRSAPPGTDVGALIHDALTRPA